MAESYGETPIIDRLLAHAAAERVSLHVPGHHQGRALLGKLDHWLGQATKLDVTELPGLDNLHHANDCIRASQDLTADYYGSSRCLFSVNGATACVMAALAAAVADTGKRRVILLGPCHLSAWRGLVYADADPLFAATEWRAHMQTFAPPTPARLLRLLTRFDDVAAVFVTSPSYQGLVAPVRELAAVAHQFDVPLIVDEAHGAHLGLHPSFPEHSVAAGADIVIQSPHKTLPCLTQAAWVHVQGAHVQAPTLERWLLFLQTTSPSYLLLAALDAAQAWLRTEGAAAAERTCARLDKYRTSIGSAQDPMRLWIPTGSLASSRDLDERLRTQGVYLEYADATGVLAIFGFDQPEYEYARFFRGLADWRRETPPQAEAGDDVQALFAAGQDAPIVRSPSAVARVRTARQPLSAAVGRILAQPLVPYPPGVPVLWPGQPLLSEHVRLLLAWRERHGDLMGMDEQGCVEVVDED